MLSRPTRVTRAVTRTGRLNRSDWVGQISFHSHGVCIAVRVNNPRSLRRVREILAHLPSAEESSSLGVDDRYSLILDATDQHTSPGSGNCHGWYLYSGRRQLAATLDLDRALNILESWLHRTVALRSRRGLFVHAGVVGWRGQAIVIPGRSMAGKTTLVAALVRAGATYYSDEYAVFDRDGYVHPYPKPLTIRGVDGEGRPRRVVEGVDDRVGTGPLPVGRIILAQYRPGVHWFPRLLSPGQAVLALLNHTIVARIDPALALATLRQAILSAITLEGERGEAGECAEQLLKEVSVAALDVEGQRCNDRM